MECCSILCFLNEASFPCMQMSCCRQLVLHEAVFYFGDKRPWDLFNRPLSLSMDSLAPNFSVGSGEEKPERLIWTTRLHIHHGRGAETKRIRAGCGAVPLRGHACPPGRRVPSGFHALYLAPLSSRKMWDLSISGSPAGHAGRRQRKGDILHPAHASSR